MSFIPMKGHNGEIRSLLWTQNDRHIVSCDDAGAIYEWNIDRAERIYDCVEKENLYVSSTRIAPEFLFVASSNGWLQEICTGEVANEIQLENMGSITSVCGLNTLGSLFIGDDCGKLQIITLPLLESKQELSKINRFV